MTSRKSELGGVRHRRVDDLCPADLEIVRLERSHDLQFAVLAFKLPRIEVPGHLSPAEQEIARLLCDGWSPAAIARKRRRSPLTIVNQVRSIYAKLDVCCHAELLHALTCSHSPGI
jgi:DNA-binding NarL/FixJ family response regulator